MAGDDRMVMGRAAGGQSEQPGEETLPPSAILAPIRAFLAQNEQLQVLWDLFSLDVVVDANAIIQDIRWTVLKRDNPRAFPALREAIEAGTVRAIAPPQLEEEVVRHLRRIAAEEGRPAEDFLNQWQRYREVIHIVEARAELSLSHPQDPDDVPYLSLQLETGAVIRSDDTDIAGMGGKVIDAGVIVKLRQYSQDAAYVFSVRVGGVVVSDLSIEMIKNLWHLLQRGWTALKRVPPALLALLLGFVLVVLMHPTTRQSIRSLTRNAGEALQPIFDEMLSVTADVHTKYRQKLARGIESLKAAKAGIPEEQRQRRLWVLGHGTGTANGYITRS